MIVFKFDAQSPPELPAVSCYTPAPVGKVVDLASGTGCSNRRRRTLLFGAIRLWTAVILLVASTPATTTRASAQQRTIESGGDILMKALPVVTLGSTLAVPDRTGAGQFLLGFAINAATTGGLKLAVHKPRPDGSNANSFPSGHTSIAFQSASFIHFRHGLAVAVPAYAVASLVGFSRVQARKHFVDDVVVGLAIGVLSSRVVTDRRRDDAVNADPGVDLGVTFTFGSGRPGRIAVGTIGGWHR
jgi:membrane-associated phospholipid phosphatase